eukprot:Opistho-1_new@41349
MVHATTRGTANGTRTVTKPVGPAPTDEQIRLARLTHTDDGTQLTKQQLDSVGRVANITSADRELVIVALMDSNWDVETAINSLLDEDKVKEWTTLDAKRSKRKPHPSNGHDGYANGNGRGPREPREPREPRGDRPDRGDRPERGDRAKGPRGAPSQGGRPRDGAQAQHVQQEAAAPPAVQAAGTWRNGPPASIKAASAANAAAQSQAIAQPQAHVLCVDT